MLSTLTKTAPEVDVYAATADNGLSLRDLMAIVKRHRLFIIVCTLVCVALAVLFITLIKPVYEASATVRIDPSRAGSLGVNEANAGTPDPTALINTEIAVLTSDGVVRRTLASLSADDLYRLTGQHQDPSVFSRDAQALTADQEKILDDFELNLSAKLVDGTQLITVSFRNANPHLATTIVNQLVLSYTLQTFVDRDSSVTQLRKWLSAQMATLQKQVDASQDKLANFQEENNILGTSNTSTTTSDRLKLLNDRLAVAQADRILKEAQLNAAKSGDIGAIAALYPNSQLDAFEQQQAALYTKETQLAAKFGPDYPPLVEVKKQIQSQSEQIANAVESVQHRLRLEYAAAKSTQDMLQQSYDDQAKTAFLVNRNQGVSDALQAELTSSREMYDNLRRKLQQASVDAQINGIDTILVDSARVPLKPVFPKKLLILGGALFLGLFAGLAVAFVRDSSSDRLGLSANLLNTGVYPTIAVIPRGLARRSTAELAGTASSISDPSSVEAEAYSSLRNLLLLSTNDLSRRTLLVTSSRHDEGSETVAANLAAVLAKTGYSVLLVDASRQPSTLNQELGMTAEHLQGEELLHPGGRIEMPTRPVRDVSGLRFVRLERSSQEGVNEPGWDDLRNTFAHWKNSFQYVVLYAPPVLEASDALLFAKWADTVIVSSRYNSTTLRTLTMSRRLLDTVRAHVAGIVVNDVPQSAVL